MKNNKQNGSAIIESVAVSALLISVFCAILLGAYLVFARAWLDYQSESTLLCLAEGQKHCRFQLESRVSQLLPWGDLKILELQSHGPSWKIRAVWQMHQIKLAVHQSLNLQQAAKKEALHW